MKVRIFQEYSGSAFSVTLRTEDFTPEELRWIDEQGDPEINLGGTFTLPGDDEYVLASQLAKVKSGLAIPGVTKAFDTRDYENAKEMAEAWGPAIQVKIFAAMQALKDADVTDFEGETVSSPTYS